MAATYPNTGLGITVAWTNYTELNSLQLTDINWDGGSATAIDTTHYGVAVEGANEHGNMTFIASKLVDGGTFTMEFSFNPDTRIPRGVKDTVTITWPDGGTSTWAFSGIILTASGSYPKDGRMVTSCSVKVASKITITDAS